MGTCKDNMTPKTEKGKSLLDKAKDKLCGKPDSTDKAENFVDTLANLDELVGKLVSDKEDDLDKEKGKEVANEKKLAKLKTMQYHLNEIVLLADQYQKI